MKRSAIEKAAERWGQVVVWDTATDTRRGAARQPSAFNTPVGQDLYSLITEPPNASLGLFQQSTRWYGYPPSDPGADAIKFLNIMAAEAEDSRTLISSSITAMAQAIQDTFGCPPEHRPGGGGLAS
jgi:hypothetical protein